jgi:6-pyruvoyltetrahydropterin/6-carboxytetrahydropterin synthase
MAGYEIILESEFSAAHRLRLADGNLEPLHGHNWRVEVHLEGPELDSAGMLADFTVLRAGLRQVTQGLHDTCLNDLPAFATCSPSTEHVARHIHDRFVAAVPTGLRVTRVRVWETRDAAAAYLPDGGPLSRSPGGGI